MLPGTVSMWPRRTMVRDADGSPSSPTALPASSTKARSKPAPRICAASQADATDSCLESDGISTSPRTRSVAASLFILMRPSGLQLFDGLRDRLHADVNFLLADHERRQQSKH